MSLVVSVMTMDAIVVAGDTRAIDITCGRYHSAQKVFVVGRNIVGAVGYSNYAVQPMRDARTVCIDGDTLDFARQLGECALADHMARDGKIPSRWPRAKVRPASELSKHGDEFVVAGYGADPITGKDGPRLYELRSGNRYVPVPLDMEPYSALGFRDVAEHMLRVLFRSGISIDDAKRLAAFVICETSRANVGVAVPIQMAVADRDGARMVDPAEVDSLVRASPQLSWDMVFGRV